MHKCRIFSEHLAFKCNSRSTAPLPVSLDDAAGKEGSLYDVQDTPRMLTSLRARHPPGDGSELTEPRRMLGASLRPGTPETRQASREYDFQEHTFGRA